MDEESALTLSVQFLHEPALWSWEIRDAGAAHVVQGSWSDDWMGYPTRYAACEAGLTRLGQLVGRLDEDAIADRLEACQLEHTSRQVLGSAG